MTSDQTPLRHYIDAWKASVDDAVALLRSLDEADWSRPTDLPGWDVRAVAAHLAHLESELSGTEQSPVDVPELDHVVSPMGRYTEQGPLARSGWSSAAIVDELEQAAGARHRALLADPPCDGAAAPPITPGGIGWSWETLLRNRPLDVWMHEQDIRRAVGRPGGLDTPGAAHTVMVFTQSFAYSVGKRVAPPAGTTVLLDVRGTQPVHLVVEVGEDGRARPANDDPAAPTVHLVTDTETFVILGGGRRSPHELPVEIAGDEELGRAVLAAMAVTP